MKRFAIFLLLGIAASTRHADPKSAPTVPKSAALPSPAAGQSMIPAKAMAEMHLIPIPKDKAQLNRLLAMGYTVHKDHMHPPGVKECPLDKNSGGVVE